MPTRVLSPLAGRFQCSPSGVARKGIPVLVTRADHGLHTTLFGGLHWKRRSNKLVHKIVLYTSVSMRNRTALGVIFAYGRDLSRLRFEPSTRRTLCLSHPLRGYASRSPAPKGSERRRRLIPTSAPNRSNLDHVLMMQYIFRLVNS